MSETHQVSSNLDNKFRIGLILNTSFTIFEFIMGFVSGSLALVSDASHNLTDSLSLVIAFLANKVSKRSATIDKTYGYGRATILAALINALILFALAFYIFYEAYQRILEPEPVEGGIVMVVAFVGIIINGSIAFIFLKNREDLNTRAAFLSMAFDTLASVGALLAGLIILLTGKTLVDPLISIIIGCMLIFSAWGVVRSALHTLLDGVPEGVDVQKVKQALIKTAGVKGVDDLHIWALSSTSAALSCHLVIVQCSLAESIEMTKKIKEMLHDKFNIDHATIEPELTEGPHDKERTDEGI